MAGNTFPFTVEDKVFLVTGGAAGVGAALVRALLNEDARCVVFLDIHEREGLSLEAELLQKFGALTIKFIKCDISDEAQLSAAFDLVLDKYRRLDAVINNAGILSADEGDFKKIIDVNFSATVSSTMKAIETMSVEKGGCGGVVLNVSSMLALGYSSHLPVYAATKSAVLNFSISIGDENNYSKSKVCVMAVCLGPTDTAILHRQNLQNFNKACAKCLIPRVSAKQRVESAATGIIEVIKRAASGSTWVIANDQPAQNITDDIKRGYKAFSQCACKHD